MPDDRLDRLVDDAVQSYGAASEGLEGRILTALAAERASATPTRWFVRPRTWIFSGALAACALIAIFIALRPTHPPEQQQQIAHAVPPAPVTQRVPALPVPHATAPRTLVSSAAKHPRLREHRPAPLPKQQLFPAPQPLSPQLAALIQYAAHAPAQQRQALVEAQAQADAPIAIAPLRIPPLNISSPQEDR